MLFSKNNYRISKDMSKYIMESTNKYIQRKLNDKKENGILFKPSNQDNNFYYLLPFVSIFSFLAGYNYKTISST